MFPLEFLKLHLHLYFRLRGSPEPLQALCWRRLEEKQPGVEACVVEKVPKYKQANTEPDLWDNGFTIFRHSTGTNGKVGMSPCFYMIIKGEKVEGKDLKE